MVMSKYIKKSKRGVLGKSSPFLFYFDIFDKFLAQAAILFGSMLVILSVAIVFYSVLMRYIINIPQTWTDELVSYFLVSIVMCGVAGTLRRNDHITVDLISSKLSHTGQRVVDLWGMIAVVLVSVAMFFSSFEMVAFSYRVDLISDGYVEAPMWIPQSSLLFGYGLLILSSLNRFARIYFHAIKTTDLKPNYSQTDLSN